MDRAKAAVYLLGLFGVVTVGQAAGLASMAGFEPQLSLFVVGGVVIVGVTARSASQGCYEEFAVFRRRELLFWAVVVGVAVYLVGVVAQFV